MLKAQLDLPYMGLIDYFSCERIQMLIKHVSSLSLGLLTCINNTPEDLTKIILCVREKRLFYDGYIIKSLFKPSARIIIVRHIKV